MLAETQRHLITADENRSFALDMLAPVAIRPASSRWAAVVAFYAAVHYVNAYLWEYLHIEPSNHNERSRRISASSDLQLIGQNCTLLREAAFNARYVAGYQLSPADIQELIDIDLEAVRTIVLGALGNET